MSSAPLIFVVSDATGGTAESVVRAALLQFGHERAKLRIFPQIRTPESIERVLSIAEEQNALIVYTLVNSDLRDQIQAGARQRRLATVDILSALIYRLADFLGRAPEETPGLMHRMDDAYFRRVEAVEFTMRNDDGQNPSALKRADIVLVGVSRTSKTPVSAVLAGRGFKVSNLPLVPGVEPPPELFDLKPGRVFGLTIQNHKLLSIRRARLAQMGVERDGSYTDRDAVNDELRWARSVFGRRPDWPVIDVTTMAVEEPALELIQRRQAILLESEAT